MDELGFSLRHNITRCRAGVKVAFLYFCTDTSGPSELNFNNRFNPNLG